MKRDYTYDSTEHTLYDGHPSWWVYWKSLTISILLMTTGIGFLLLPYPYFKRQSTRYLITSERVMIATGIFNKNSTEFRVDNVRQIQAGATWTERLQGHGHLTLEAHTGAVMTFHHVSDHQEVANKIRRNQGGQRR